MVACVRVTGAPDDWEWEGWDLKRGSFESCNVGEWGPPLDHCILIFRKHPFCIRDMIASVSERTAHRLRNWSSWVEISKGFGIRFQKLCCKHRNRPGYPICADKSKVHPCSRPSRLLHLPYRVNFMVSLSNVHWVHIRKCTRCSFCSHSC
jgi:hypothetical protein